MNVDPLAIAHSILNLVVLSVSSEASRGFVEDGSEPLCPIFGGNTYASTEGVIGMSPNHLFVREVGIGQSSFVCCSTLVKAFRFLNGQEHTGNEIREHRHF